MRVAIVPLIASLAVAACVSDGEREPKLEPSQDYRVGEQTNRICFTRSIGGFSPWDAGDGVILTKGVRDQFLVTFSGICAESRGAIRIGFNSRFSSSGCLDRGDSIYFSDSLSGRGSALSGSCRINAIYTFDRNAQKPDEDTESDEE